MNPGSSVMVGASLVLIGVLAACGSSSSSGAGGNAAGLVNGCDAAQATDMTAQTTVDLTWTLPHHECILVRKGTTVRWDGDFQVHPLAGGEAPDQDPASPISAATPAGNVESVTFAQAGEFPYFCQVHVSQMQGVVYVQ